MTAPRKRFWATLAFVIWVLVLSKFILFKHPLSYYQQYFKAQYHSGVIRQGWKKANLTPMATVRHFFRSKRLRTQYKVDNIGGNIIGFIPLGFVLCLLRSPRKGPLYSFLQILSISLFFEGVQLFTGLGALDIDDVILNTFGGVLGIFFFHIFHSVQYHPSPDHPATDSPSGN